MLGTVQAPHVHQLWFFNSEGNPGKQARKPHFTGVEMKPQGADIFLQAK